MISSFLQQLYAGCRQAGMAEGAVLIGLSGGPDSVALIRGLMNLREEYSIEIHAAHLNHQLRGEESDQDADWVKQFCEQNKIPLTLKSLPVAEYAREKRLGIEEAARRVRYEFLNETASELECRQIGLAHHADDQVETVLHHFLRGTGLRGLAGMKMRRQLNEKLVLVRPMLGIRRADIVAALKEWGQVCLQDSTNSETHYTRNRLRLELLPKLEQDYNKQVTEAILSLSRQARESQELMQHDADQLLDQALAEQCETFCRISKLSLQGKPRHLIREAFVQLWRRQNWARQQMNFTQWDRLAGIALGEAEGGTFPGPVEVRRVRKELHLTCSGN
ncbi:MAG: tRNA lysidine(34) synthetase TilS [Planctomycetaceae bacterium]|nr:tRNA lysidine(34) synthetase TilS [Planctomycetaceae bacterium]